MEGRYTLSEITNRLYVWIKPSPIQPLLGLTFSEQDKAIKILDTSSLLFPISSCSTDQGAKNTRFLPLFFAL